MVSLKCFVLALVISISLLYAMLLGGVLAVQISSVEFVSHQLTQSLHAQTISVLNEQLSIPKGAARMLAEDFLCRQYHARGPPYDGTLPAMVTYAQRYPGLSILVIFGKEGTMFELRKETVDGPTNLVEMTRPPTYLREHHRLHLAESNRTAPYVSYSYLRTTAQRTFGPNETWWQGEAIPKEGNWMLMTWLDRAILLCYSAKIMYNGTFEGVVYADYTLQALVHILRNIHLGEGGKLAIIDNLDRLIASSSLKDDKLAQRVDTLPRADNATDRAIADAAKFLFSRRAAGTTVVHGTTHSIGAGGKTYVLSTGNMVFDSAKNTNWTVLLLLPRATFFAASDNGMIFSVAAVAVFFVCSFLISVTLVSAVSRHIRRIIGQVDSVVTLRDPHFDDISTARSNSPRFLRVSEVQKLQDSVTRMKMILQSFEKYIPVELLKYLISANRPAELGLERATASVMFLDVVGFTSIMERVPIPELIEQFTEYCNEAISTIIENNGTLDKMMGDGMMAFFGCPPTILRDHQYWAARCALHLQRMMVRLRAKWAREGRVQLAIRIGVASGGVSVGNVGSAHRFQYTVLGDVVNLAARMETLNKRFGTQTLLTGHSFEPLDDSFIGRRLGTVRVKGRSARTRVFELVTSVEMYNSALLHARPLTAGQMVAATARSDILDEAPSEYCASESAPSPMNSARSSITELCAACECMQVQAQEHHLSPCHLHEGRGRQVDAQGGQGHGQGHGHAQVYVQGHGHQGCGHVQGHAQVYVQGHGHLGHPPGQGNVLTPLTHATRDPLFRVDLPDSHEPLPRCLHLLYEYCALFTRAVSHYESRRFDKAAQLLRACLEINSAALRAEACLLEQESYQQACDAPCRMVPQADAVRSSEALEVYTRELLELCAAYAENPPPQAWDPVITMTEK